MSGAAPPENPAPDPAGNHDITIPAGHLAIDSVAPSVAITTEGSGNTDIIQFISGPPVQAFRQLDFHAAYMLATLPRKRADDPTSTPLACTLTAAVPALVGFVGGFSFSKPYFSIDFASMLYIAIFVGCFAWFLVKRNEDRDQKTSLQYLEELRTGTAVSPTSVPVAPWWKFWA
jgi:hypothetical protein